MTGSAVLRVREDQRRVTVVGAPPDYLAAANRQLSAGRFVGSAQSGPTAREIVLGPTPVAELFGNDNVVNQIIVRASGTATVPAATAQTTAVLDQRHHVYDPSQRDFEVLSLQTLIEQREQFLAALRAFIGAIAAIALIVGGIGVANIMLVSVTERTRETGLRKALGATRHEVLRQFLIESSMLSATGGLAGMLLGIGLTEAAAFAIPRVTANFPPPTVSPTAVVLSVAISALIGVAAGSYPAGRAARMRPVDALRFQ
ncbi:ABC transporter permease [Pseudonocardia acaciae]|uniref:ABC transporter permease n=1 Tax=Pseudonocardia acaciae TaxID=551276 RepID=UPI000ACD3E3C|nr:ABC transporter permease [Pseudonocardia acaciae]